MSELFNEHDLMGLRSVRLTDYIHGEIRSAIGTMEKTLFKYNPIVLKDTPELTVLEQLRMYAEHYAPLQISFNSFIPPGQVWFNDGVFYVNEKWLRENFTTFDEAVLKSMGIKA